MNTDQPPHIILHLSLIDGIGPTAIERIISFLGRENLDRVYTLTHSDFVRGVGLGEKQTAKIMGGLADTSLLEQELELIQKHGISWAICHEKEYPALLTTIHMPPTVLYWKGTVPGHNTIAVVGSRDANAYGRMAIDTLVPPLVQHGWAIISGGARGADTMAHEKALDEGGITVAVLGSGLLRPYPPENTQLFEEIIARGGAVVSAFPALMRPLAENFPARNRVIAGLSRGCIVVQAAAKSGARITADYCLSQGREVFAVPGPINDSLSAGCHELIAQGAKLTAKAADVLGEFGIEMQQDPIINPGVQAPTGRQNYGKRQRAGAGDQSQQKLFTPAFYAEPVDPAEALLLDACGHASTVDELLEATGLPLIQLSKMLFDMQIKGKLSQNMAGLWEKQ